MPFIKYPERQVVNKVWWDPSNPDGSFTRDSRCSPGVVVFLDDSEDGALLGEYNTYGGTSQGFGVYRSQVVRELIDLRDVVTSLTSRRASRGREVSDDQIRMLREDARATDDRDIARACNAALGVPTGDGALGLLDQETCREYVAEIIHRDRHYWGEK